MPGIEPGSAPCKANAFPRAISSSSGASSSWVRGVPQALQTFPSLFKCKWDSAPKSGSHNHLAPMKRLDHLTLGVWLGLSMAVVGRSAGCPSLRKPEVLDPSLALTLKSKKEAQRLLSSGTKAHGEFSAQRGQCRGGPQDPGWAGGCPWVTRTPAEIRSNAGCIDRWEFRFQCQAPNEHIYLALRMGCPLDRD